MPTLINADAGSMTSMILAAVRIAAAAVLALVRTGAVAAPAGMMIEATLNVASPAAAAGSSFHLSQAEALAGIEHRHLGITEEVARWPRHVGDHEVPGRLVTARPTASLPRLLQAAA